MQPAPAAIPLPHLRALLPAAPTATLPASMPATAVPAAALLMLLVAFLTPALRAVLPAFPACLLCLATDLTDFFRSAVGVCAAHKLLQSRSNSSRTQGRAMPLLLG